MDRPMSRKEAEIAETVADEAADSHCADEETAKVIPIETARRASEGRSATPVANDDLQVVPDDGVARLQRDLDAMDDLVREFADMLGDARLERANAQKRVVDLEDLVEDQQVDIERLETKVWQQSEFLAHATRAQERAASLLDKWQQYATDVETLAADVEAAQEARIALLEVRLAIAEAKASTAVEIADELVEMRWMRKWKREAFNARIDAAR